MGSERKVMTVSSRPLSRNHYFPILATLLTPLNPHHGKNIIILFKKISIPEPPSIGLFFISIVFTLGLTAKDKKINCKG